MQFDLARYREWSLFPDEWPEILEPGDCQRIIDHFLKGKQPAPNGHSFIYVLAGGTASGKSELQGILSASGEIPRTVVVGDPDAVLPMMPGYLEQAKKNVAVAFRKYEMPARFVSNLIISIAVQKKMDVLYIRSCALPDSLHFLNDVWRREYSFVMHGVFCPIELAHSRCAARIIRGERFMDPTEMEDRHRGFARHFRIYVEGDSEAPVAGREVTLWKNNGSLRKVAVYRDGQFVEGDQDAAEEFMATKDADISGAEGRRRVAMSRVKAQRSR